MGSKAKVLIIDDDPDILSTTRLFLEARGFQVFTAPGPKEGMEQFEEEKPDVIVLDVMMPSSTEGFQWLLKLRQHPNAKLRNVPVIMLTSIHETTRLRFHEGDADESGEYLPAQAFFDKPVDPDELASKIKDLLADEALG